ncbi:hypothetical protein RCZ04_05350 [Capnocytophaga sp. HP1101]
MRKLLILASLALMGVACCKSDDDNNNNNNNNIPDPWEEETLLPTKYIIERSEDDITEMVYTIEDGFIKEAREFKVSRTERKEVKRLIIKPVKGKKLPARIDIEKDGIYQRTVSFKFNDQDQVTEIMKDGNISKVVTFGYKDGKLSQFAPIPSKVYNLTHPDTHTVVAKGKSGYDRFIYTFSPEGNLIKKVYEYFSKGVLSFSKTYVYEYDLQKKNPKRNLQIQLITLANSSKDFNFYELYEATNSKNLVVKEAEQTQQQKDANDPNSGLTTAIYLRAEYKNEANNPQGYATKITKIEGRYDSFTEKYEYQ